MAKLPTFQASKVSGGSAMVQAPTLQRSMARSFKKSTNIKASDIYDSTGDQALIGALNTGISYYNKVQVQRDNVLFEQRKTELESDLSRLELELEQKGIDAHTHASQFVKQGSDRYKSGLSKQNQANFDNYFARRSVGIAANATTITSNAVKQSYFDNGKLINERNKLGIANGSKDPEQALTEINEHITLGVKDNYFSPESGQSQSEAAIKEYKFIDNESLIAKAESSVDLKFIEENIEADSAFLNNTQKKQLKTASKAKEVEIFKTNREVENHFFNEMKNKAKYNMEISEEEIERFGSLFGPNALTDLNDTLENNVIRSEMYHAVRAEFRGEQFTEKNVDAKSGKMLGEMLKNAPVQQHDIISRDFNRVVSAIKDEINFKNSLIVSKEVANSVSLISQGESSIDTQKSYIEKKYGADAVKVLDSHLGDYNKDPMRAMTNLIYGEKALEIEDSITQIMSPDFDVNDPNNALILSKAAASVQSTRNEVRHRHPQISAELTQPEVERMIGVFSDLSPDKDINRQQAIAKLVAVHGMSAIPAIGTQLASQKLMDGDTINAAEIAVTFDGYVNKNYLVPQTIRKAKTDWQGLKPTDKSDAYAKVAELTVGMPNDNMPIERKELAARIGKSYELKGIEAPYEQAVNMVFDMKQITTSIGQLGLPNKIQTESGAVSLKHDEVESRLQSISKFMMASPEMIISSENLARYSSVSEGSMLYKALHGSNNDAKQEAWGFIKKMFNEEKFEWHTEGDQTVGLYIYAENPNARELVFKLPLKYLNDQSIDAKGLSASGVQTVGNEWFAGIDIMDRMVQAYIQQGIK